MPMKDASEKLREKAKGMKEDVASLVSDVSESLPRPLTQRPTFLLKQPVLKTVRDRLAERKTSLDKRKKASE